MQMLRADVMVLATHHVTNAREEAFDEVRVNAIEAIGFRVVDSVRPKQNV